MSIIDVELVEESRSRYLTYALSVVNSRALPDVRDGLKPVQRRILYAMINNLHLSPDKHHRKSAAVVGEVLARYHPHGDSACYEAMVRMAQDFSLRYPLVDGQGNFGSLDGDAAAAYRYTEAKLTKLALEVIGDIGQNTVSLRDNFDQTTLEPVVLPSRVPNLLINGASGIAVGMATAIPPHNLNDVIKALIALLDDPEISDTKLISTVKAPDFPTGCSIINTKDELKEIYRTGRGPIKMRGDYKVEKLQRDKEQVIITSVPYGIDKSQLIEKIADLIIAKKLPQLLDVRDESTREVRIVLEVAQDQSAEKAMAYLYKNTALQSNFNVNLTALIPTNNPFSGRPELLSLRQMLEEFVAFRLEVTEKKLVFEREKLAERIHLLEGMVLIYDVLSEVIELIRKSDGRTDAAGRLQKRFKLSEVQALFIVDLRLYQLSKTSIDEINSELKEKSTRVKAINNILKSDKELRKEISSDLKRISDTYGDARRSKLITDHEELEYDEDSYVQHEDVFAIITKDAWLKRIRTTNDPSKTKIREGDAPLIAAEANTKDSIAIFTNQGNVFVTKILDFPSTSGYGDPAQKMFRFKDGEQVVNALVLKRGEGEQDNPVEIFLYTRKGFGFRLGTEHLADTKKSGKRLVRLSGEDLLQGVEVGGGKLAVFLSAEGYGLCVVLSEITLLTGPGKGVILQKLPKGDSLVLAKIVDKKDKIEVLTSDGKQKEVDVSSMTITSRAKRGLKVVKRGLPVVGESRSYGHNTLWPLGR